MPDSEPAAAEWAEPEEWTGPPPEAVWTAAVERLVSLAELVDPEWARLLREQPAAYVPHRTYGRLGRPACCQFPADHPIHQRPWFRLR
ncbi:MAG TPA: hypothetical protein VGJ54_11155 [Streptosporangiaceae bacterium]|jgi:hypothetical protein